MRCLLAGTKFSVTDGGTTTNNYTLDTGKGWPRVVVSYQSENMVELEETRELLSQWGCYPWDGRQVKAGKDWVSQWLAMANSEDTALFVFLISRAFSCQKSGCGACAHGQRLALSSETETDSRIPILTPRGVAGGAGRVF